jgi:arabinofuranosyltransferase
MKLTLTEPHARKAAQIAAALVLLLVVARGWVADDAVITARSVDNLLHGYGLRWNAGERVQVFTHPSWALLSLVPMALGAGWYLSLIGLSMGTTVVFGLLFLRARGSGPALLVAVAALGFSAAFLDFSSSGLENPLTHLLLLALVASLPTGTPAPGDVRRTTFLFSLLVVTRMDAGVLALPCCAYLSWAAYQSGQAPRRIAGEWLIGLLPFLAWEAFSIVYYGFPFPNTAYAKLNTGIARATLLRMGVAYYRFALICDPWTLLGAGLLGALSWRFGKTGLARAVLLGAGLYYLYVLWIGGDFMGGRFFAAPLVLTAALLASPHVELDVRAAKVALALTVLVGTVGMLLPDHPRPTGHSGPVNERTQSSRSTALWRVIYQAGVIDDGSLRRGAEWRAQPRPIRHAYAIGLLGFAAGPEVHIVDHLALADAFLARLPAGFDPDPQPGHFERMGQWTSPIPVTKACPPEHEVCRFWQEYERSLQDGACRLSDANLCRYWSRLRSVTEGPLFTRERWLAIVELNLGRLDLLIDRDHYRNVVRSYPGSLPR